RKRRYHRAQAVAGRGDPGGKAAAIGKPLHHVTDDANVDNACADSTEQPVSEVQTYDCGRSCSEHPAQSRQRAAKREQGPGPELIDDEPLTGGEKRLDNDEERKRNLDLSKACMERTH